MINVVIDNKTLNKYLEKKEFIKILQSVGNNYESIQELFFVVEAYLGLGRFDLSEKLLINWQSKLSSPEEWAYWCYYYAKSLSGMKNKIDALTTLNFANEFMKTIQNSELHQKIIQLQTELKQTIS